MTEATAVMQGLCAKMPPSTKPDCGRKERTFGMIAKSMLM
jgi:hypothetical protein